MAARIETLAQLLAPVGEEDFLADYHGRAPLYVAGDAGKFAGVLSWAGLNRILSMDVWNAGALELFLDGQKVPPHAYCRNEMNRMRLQVMQPDADKVTELTRRGASLRLNEIETLEPGVLAVAETIAQRLGAKTSANGYCSWRAHQALKSHFDRHDVFVLHLHGEKRWNVYEGRAEAPIEHEAFGNIPQAQFDRMKGEVAQKLTMTPGDLLYLPRGQFHDALASTRASLHVTISVVEPTGLNWLSKLWEMAVRDPAFRATLPMADGEDGRKALAAHLEQLADRFRSMAASEESLAQATALRREFPIKRQTFDLKSGDPRADAPDDDASDDMA